MKRQFCNGLGSKWGEESRRSRMKRRREDTQAKERETLELYYTTMRIFYGYDKGLSTARAVSEDEEESSPSETL